MFRKSLFFSGTIATNVAGRLKEDADLDIERVQQALQAAQAWDFVSELDKGINAVVDSGGVNFSGGQRQRLAIARAIYRCLPDREGNRQADILIFDDSFSALDNTTDAQLRHNLHTFIEDVCVLIVGQRISTIRLADVIHVIDQGRIVGTGTHEELLATNNTYQEIVASQMSEKEAR